MKKIVVIGGGTGLPVLLRGLKQYDVDLTAIVTVADDGGSSGRLRDELDMPPPGDIRNVLAALSDVEPLIIELFQHRFENGNGLSGHSLGNLILAAMTAITGDFVHAVREMGKVLNVRGKVLPAANESVVLHAEMEDGTIVSGESKIPYSGKKIKRVFLTPSNIEPLKTLKKIFLSTLTALVGRLQQAWRFTIRCNLLNQMYRRFVSVWQLLWGRFCWQQVPKENVLHCQIARS